MTAVIIALMGAVMSWAFTGEQLTNAQSDEYAQAGKLDSQLSAAHKAGFTDSDLKPVSDRRLQVQAALPPLFFWEQADFYRSQASSYRDLQAQLKQAEAAAVQQATQQADSQLAAAKTAVDHARAVDVPEQQVADLQGRLDGLSQRRQAVTAIGDVRKLGSDADAVAADAGKAATAQDAENAAIQQAATALVQAKAGNLGAVQQAGNQSLAQGRNDATIAAYESKPGRFAAINQLMALYNRMEHYTGRLGSGDVNQAAVGAAGIQRYAGQIHDLLMGNLGPKHIIVSFQDQHVWAYEGSKAVMDSAVTTGIRGVTDYGTDFGPMKVLFTSHPWTMHSPYPKGSPYWYPDTVVQWTTFFTDTGESFHDASWEPDYLLGPGSQYDASTRSHGCIHLPYGLAQWLFGWADVGTPVDVVPGDGQPVAAQLAEITTDDQGVPHSQ